MERVSQREGKFEKTEKKKFQGFARNSEAPPCNTTFARDHLCLQKGIIP